MTFGIKRQTPLPLFMALFPPIFYPTFILLQLNLTYIKRISQLFSVKTITLKSSYNWFKIDILRLLQPPTAIFTEYYSAMFIVTSNTIYTKYKVQFMCKRVLTVRE